MTLNQFRKRITTNATTNIIGQPCSITQIYISVENPGSAWKFSMQDQSSPPFVWIPQVTLAAQTLSACIPINFDEPLLMTNGVDVITSGTTPGAVSVSITGWVN